MLEGLDWYWLSYDRCISDAFGWWNLGMLPEALGAETNNYFIMSRVVATFFLGGGFNIVSKISF